MAAILATESVIEKRGANPRACMDQNPTGKRGKSWKVVKQEPTREIETHERGRRKVAGKVLINLAEGSKQTNGKRSQPGQLAGRPNVGETPRTGVSKKRRGMERKK